MNYYDPFTQFNPVVVDYIDTTDKLMRQLNETGSNSLYGGYASPVPTSLCNLPKETGKDDILR